MLYVVCVVWPEMLQRVTWVLSCGVLCQMLSRLICDMTIWDRRPLMQICQAKSEGDRTRTHVHALTSPPLPALSVLKGRQEIMRRSCLVLQAASRWFQHGLAVMRKLGSASSWERGLVAIRPALEVFGVEIGVTHPYILAKHCTYMDLWASLRK